MMKPQENFIASNYRYYYLEAFNKCNHPAMRADYFRLCYLYKKGGFYVDADDIYTGDSIDFLFRNNCIKVQTLCHDIVNDKMINPNDYIESDTYFTNCIYYVNNNPIVSPPNHPMIKIALEKCTQSILNMNTDLRDIHTVTGPTNFTASLVQYAIQARCSNAEIGCEFILNWMDIAYPIWPLEYREDNRNWRNWDGRAM